MFDLSLPKLLILAVLALVVFGPNELPKIAAQAATSCATCGGSQKGPRPTCARVSARSSPTSTLTT